MKIDTLTPNDTIVKELGMRLRRVRKQQGFSQEKLAEEAGIGVATLRRIEDGQDSQLSSWLKILTTLQMSHSIEALLPEAFNSPMAEVVAQNKRSGSKKKASNQVSESRGFWGDEQV